MAKSAVARLGDVKRGMIERKRKTEMVSGAISAVGTAATFAAGQFNKAKTAWSEYETGYKELGGTDFKGRPKFGQKGFFKGPEGEVGIGGKMYDRKKIKEVGGFLGSDAASVLSDKTRAEYKGRIGRAMTTEEAEKYRPKRPVVLPLVDEEFDIDTGFTRYSPGITTVGQDWGTPPPPPMTIKGDDPDAPDITAFKDPGQYARKGMHEDDDFLFESGESAGYAISGATQPGIDAPVQESKYGGVDPNTRGPNLGSMWSQFKSGPLKSAMGIIKQQFTEEPEYGQALPLSKQVVRKEKDISAEPTNGKTFPSWPKLPTFAHGGDFITNGPQKILVGDNPGGRERVTIEPLSSKNDEEYKKRNWLESLYENNRRRKVY